ncbi:SDR family NAD(P)-dependent oxidoreductase [Ancylobacter terrae]|uniref:SDR family NAD(P)-dependent oxidoreductase n=1 Tax=Ancylobacter sp. sgz301288 TaxID=3342077 RepID=UPI00385CE7DE
MTGVAVVTGGASGIGEAAARAYVAAGWHVVLADIDTERGEAIAAELAPGGRISFMPLDVAREEAVEAFAAAVYDRYGRVDALVNSAGLLQNAVRSVDMSIAEFDRIHTVNVRGTLLANRAFGRRMCAAKSGAIVNLCSLTSFRPSAQPAYAIGKAGLKMMTELMAAEFGPHGVRVNAVAPGYTLTPAMKNRIERGERDPNAVIAKSALRRFVEPAEVGAVILFLTSAAASAITGATLPVDCGWLATSAYTAHAAQPPARD